MLFSPPVLPFSLLLGLLSFAVLGGGIYLIWAWFAGVVVGTAYLVGGLAMFAFTFLGRPLVLMLRRRGYDEPEMTREGSSFESIPRADGSELHVELYGPEDAPPIVLTHGWGVDSRVWYYTKKALGNRFRLIAWDLPGLGESGKPDNNDFRLERLADDLNAVLELAGDRPAVLLGHSIGGMTTLTWCRLFPARLRRRVAGLVLVDTSYTNPVKTATASGFFQTIQRPIVEPLLHLIAWLSPLVWAMNWLSYLNGTSHIVSILAGFAGSETRGQLDFATRFPVLASPGVQARGVLAMLRYDATSTLSTIAAPVLVLAGHLDRMTIPEANQFIAGQIPNGVFLELSPGGHMSILEQHEQFNEAVSEFVESCQPLAQARSA